MHGAGWQEDVVGERNVRLLAEAEHRRLARLVSDGPTVRARVARRLFEAAVAVEREATWRAVWEKLEAPRQL